jgi:flavin-dependent dehydrogenase
MTPSDAPSPPLSEVDLLVVGLGPGGCMAALTAQRLGLRVMGVEARDRVGTRGRLVVVRPQAQALLTGLGLNDITGGRRTTTLRHVEECLRQRLCEAAQAPEGGALPRPAVHWHTRVTALDSGADHVRVTLQDAEGGTRTVRARHVVDASGGRLEDLGRTPRVRTGARHIVVTAEYATPPWYEGIAGAHDPRTGDAYFLIPMRGRTGITAYLDSPPGEGESEAALTARFNAIGERLGLRDIVQEVQAVDVVQRLLPTPSPDRVLPIGDAAGTVDLWIGAGMSTAIEDGDDAARAIAQAQRCGDAAEELRLTREASARAVARHKARIWLGRVVVAARPLVIRMWPKRSLETLGRDEVSSPRWLWQGIRVVFGKRPEAPVGGRD